MNAHQGRKPTSFPGKGPVSEEKVDEGGDQTIIHHGDPLARLAKRRKKSKEGDS
jgi:hypothetical protein